MAGKEGACEIKNGRYFGYCNPFYQIGHNF